MKLLLWATLTALSAVANAQSNFERFIHLHNPQAAPSSQTLSLPDSKLTQAEAFTRIYATFCLKHINELEKLRQRMALAPQLPKDKARSFLQGYAGEAWLVPESSGQYVVAIPKDQNTCYAYAYRAPKQKVEELFASIASAPSDTFNIKRGKSETKSMSYGQLDTLNYEWRLSGSDRKTILRLTTTSSSEAPVQAYAVATLLDK